MHSFSLLIDTRYESLCQEASNDSTPCYEAQFSCGDGFNPSFLLPVVQSFIPVDGVSCQFALHYAFQSEQRVINVWLKHHIKCELYDCSTASTHMLRFLLFQVIITPIDAYILLHTLLVSVVSGIKTWLKTLPTSLSIW